MMSITAISTLILSCRGGLVLKALPYLMSRPRLGKLILSGTRETKL